MGLPWWHGGKESPTSAGDAGTRVDPWAGRSHRGGNGNSLQYSSLENPVDRGASQAAVHGVAESDTNACVHTHTHKHDTRPSLHRRGSHSLFHLLLHCSRPCSALGTHSPMYLEYSPGGGVQSQGRGAVPGEGCSPGAGVQSRGKAGGGPLLHQWQARVL